MPQRIIRTIIANQKVVTVAPDLSIAQAAKTMREARVGALLVVEGGRLAGIFTERDAVFRVLAEGRDAQSTPVSAVMTADPLTIGPDKPFAHAMHIMHDNGFRHIPVVENGQPLGVLSARDALGVESAQFEEDLVARDHLSEIL